MRMSVALACCLGLLAAVQALALKASPYGLLQLEGPVSTASLASTQGKRHHHSHNHKKSHYEDSHYGDNPSYAPYDSQYPPHDSYYMQGPHDSYWDPRYQAKAELIACVKAATASFDKDDTSTWEAAGEFLAHCLEQHLGGCHDVPGLPLELTSTLPYILFLSGLETLVANPSGLDAAKLVFSFYLMDNMGDGADNPFNTGLTSCSAKLAALLQSGAYWGKDTSMFARLAKVVIMVIEDALKGRSNLSPCVHDIPAVLLALSSTYCPASGQLYNPFTGDSTRCTYNSEADYEDSSSALLAASIWTGLLLSNNPRLVHLGFQLAFDMNLLALAGIYPSSFDGCNSDLAFFLGTFPAGYSGRLGPRRLQVTGHVDISSDARNVLCGAIGLMSGANNWDENVLWQGVANVANAIFKTIQLGLYAQTPISITSQQVHGLCAVTKAVWSFANKTQSGEDDVIVVMVPADVTPPEVSRPCFTAPEPVDCPNPGKTFGGLADGHSLDTNSFTAQVCGWTNASSRLAGNSRSTSAADRMFDIFTGRGRNSG